MGGVDVSPATIMTTSDLVSARHVFTSIYERDAWKGGSGEGSTSDNTVLYREYLQTFLREKGVRTVVDLGCGDWQFSQMIDWKGISYLGVDVVPELVRNNRRQFGNDHINFALIDDPDSPLPGADLLIVKDVLQHWPTAMIQSFLKTLGRFRFSLITNCIDAATNTDCVLGGYRGIDLRLPPFSLPCINVLEYEWHSHHHGRSFRKVTFLYEHGEPMRR